MRQPLFSLALFLATTAQAADKSAPKSADPVVVVQYYKTGQEDDAAAAKLGQVEVDNSNPCVLKMRRDAQAVLKREDFHDAIRAVEKTLDLAAPKPQLVLRFQHEAIELRFEVRVETPKSTDQVGTVTETTKYRKGVFLTDRPGSWADRLDGDQCHVSEAKVTALIDELREADRLLACMRRKRDLLDASAKISNYLHSYVPVDWLDEARRRLVLQNTPAGDLLREDTSVYRSGNATFRECVRGLRLLEEEASSSVRVLSEVRDGHKGTDVPSKDIDELERLLSGAGK